MRIRSILAFAALWAITGCSSTKSPSEIDVWSASNYEVSCDMIGTEGVQTMIVASFGDNVTEALAQARWNAVHAILFKGIQTNVCKAPPLVGYDAYQKSVDWFRGFLAPSGGYLDFITVAGDVPIDMVYVERGVKVFSQVAVDRNSLRSQLIDADIIGEMGGVFERKQDD